MERLILQRVHITTVSHFLSLVDPIYEVPPNNDPAYLEKFAFYAHPNIWPSSSLPALQPAFMDLGKLIVSVGSLVAKQCDDFVSQTYPTLGKNFLTSAIEKSETVKARLLHYFPIAKTDTPTDGEDLDSWCGLHIDHSMVSPLN
jgi:hypothetical protein